MAVFIEALDEYKLISWYNQKWEISTQKPPVHQNAGNEVEVRLWSPGDDIDIGTISIEIVRWE